MAILDDALTAEPAALAEPVEPIEDDVVEGDADVFDDAPAAERTVADDRAPAVDAPPKLVDAVMEYFEYEEQRKEKNARRKASTARAKRDVFEFNEAARDAVTRFLGHFGPNTLIDELSPKSMENFQETIGASSMDPAARLQPVKEFLRFCKTQGYTVTPGASGDPELINLGNFLRIKRPNTAARDSSSFKHEEAQIFEMTADGLQHLHAELGQLKAEMPEAVQAVAAAREDKDIRENAPLEAAREHQERLKSRIDELEYQIAHAVVREVQETGRAKLGSRVSVVEIDAGGNQLGAAREYTLVGTTEANAAALRISVESPLGRGLLDQTANGRIEIQTPSGRKRFRLLAVNG